MKGMEDVNRLLKCRNVDNPEFIIGVDADLTDSKADRGHRFPIAGFKSALHSIQLIAGLFARVLFKFSNIIKRRTQPFDRFHAESLYKNIYNQAECNVVEFVAVESLHAQQHATSFNTLAATA